MAKLENFSNWYMIKVKSFTTTFQVSEDNAVKVSASNQALKTTFVNPSVGTFKVRCESPSRIRTSSKTLTVVESGSIVVQNVSHKELPNGKVQVRRPKPFINLVNDRNMSSNFQSVKLKFRLQCQQVSKESINCF